MGKMPGAGAIIPELAASCNDDDASMVFPAYQVHDFCETWGLNYGEVQQLLFTLPLDVQRTTLANFNGATTKDGNVLGRLKGYVASLMKRSSAKGYSAAAAQVLGYIGVVKTFDHMRGWGFIECPESHAAYAMDIFLRSRDMGGHAPAIGEPVEFTVVIGNDGFPEASDLNFQTQYHAVRSAARRPSRSTR